jgi:hypothetical protein
VTNIARLAISVRFVILPGDRYCQTNPHSLLSAMIVAVVPPVSTMLDIGAGTGSRGPANQRTFTAANQRSAYYAGCAANQRALSLAMVMSVRTAMRRAFRRRAQHQENDRQDYRQNVLDVYRSYHFHTSYGFAQKVIFCLLFVQKFNLHKKS